MAKKNQVELTPQLIRQISQKVYALWLKELRIEKERRGKASPTVRKL